MALYIAKQYNNRIQNFEDHKKELISITEKSMEYIQRNTMVSEQVYEALKEIREKLNKT